MYKIIGGDQKEYGPVSLEVIVEWIRGNQANSQTLVQKEGGPWVPLGSLPEFAPYLMSQASPAAGSPDPEPASGPGPALGSSMPPSGPSPSMYPMGGNDRDRALAAVSGPATGLLVTGIICMIVSLINTVMSLTGAGFQPPPGEIPPEMQQFFDVLQKMQGPVAIITSILGIGISALIIFAAQKMRVLQNYTLVVTGAILAVVPCISPCCCIGIPVGIWVLVVLFKPEVKAMFQ
ncbi:MAG: DUF4339 domain-containing protein [Limisphaerales bacterium]